MPCTGGPGYYDSSDSSYSSDLSSRLRATKKKLDLATRLLCALCKQSQSDLINKIENGELASWWEDHQKLDARRKAREAKKKKDAEAKRKQEEDRKKLRVQALSKLSKPEKEAIGIRK